MAIQQNINQTISLAGLLFTQTEAYKTLGQQRKLGKEVKTIDKRIGVAGKEGEMTGAKLQNIAELEGKKAELLHEKYRNSPSIKSYNVYASQFQKTQEAETAAQEAIENEARKAAEDEQRYEDKQDYEAQQEPEEGIDFENIPASNVPVENWETSPAAVARQTAETELSAKQHEMRETRARQNGFTSQRFGTTKTKINFNKGGK